MKLPISFGSRLLFRLLIPGFIVTLLAAPFVLASFESNSAPGPTAAFFVVSTIGVGMIITLMDQQIYMMLEGRRFWPRWLYEIGIANQKRRLKCWQKRAADGGPRSIEFQILAQRYPIGDGLYPPKHGEPCVMLPTELGNIVYGLETYSKTKYGADGVFIGHESGCDSTKI